MGDERKSTGRESLTAAPGLTCPECHGSGSQTYSGCPGTFDPSCCGACDPESCWLCEGAGTIVGRCYICDAPVAHDEGWQREGKAWCYEHQPVWSRA